MGLLSPAFLQKLAGLGLAAAQRSAGPRDGSRPSPRRGRSQEFADHRPYVPGDDLRFLDWHVLGRLDALWIKLFEEQTDRTALMLLDTSASMSGGKLDCARRLAAALSFVALGGTDRVAVAGLTDGGKTASPAYAPPRRGRASSAAVFHTLEGLAAAGGTDLLRASAALPRSTGPTIAVLFSDFLFEGGAGPVLRALRARYGEVFVFHVLSPIDVRPDLNGDVLLVDRETDEGVAVAVDAEVLDRYEAAVRRWAAEVETTAQKLGVGYQRLLSTADVEALVLGDLRRRGLVR